jgi:hypothetical protein
MNGNQNRSYDAGSNQTTTVVGVVGQTVEQPLRRAGGYYRVETYRGRQSLGLGICLILLGVMSVAFNATDIAVSAVLSSTSDNDNANNHNDPYYANKPYYNPYSNYQSTTTRFRYTGCESAGCAGHGIWGGIMLIIAGAFGAAAGRSRTRCMITGFLIATIIAMVASGIVTIIGAAASRGIQDDEIKDKRCDGSGQYDTLEPEDQAICDKLMTLIAMEALIAIANFIAFFLCLWGSILCCAGNSCCGGPTHGITYAVATTGATAVITQQQYSYQQPMQQQQQQQQQPIFYPGAAGAGYPVQPYQPYMMQGPPTYDNAVFAPAAAPVYSTAAQQMAPTDEGLNTSDYPQKH